jgi:UDP-N-acetylglucosamine 2-epimerase
MRLTKPPEAEDRIVCRGDLKMAQTKRRSRPTVLTVVGARPQFVKAAPLSRALRRHLREVLVHTGQHYDYEMSASFFEQLELPEPDRHLGIGSGRHGAMTGRMLEALEAAIGEEHPDAVLVYGDTNSTLAGALAAAKMHVPIIHVEAGLRSFDRRMPEEVNRRLTDHVSSLLFCPTTAAVQNLRREGIRRGVHNAGDVMMDAVLDNLARARKKAKPEVALPPRTYYLATVHRQENVDDDARLRAILGELARLPLPTLVPLHPRTRKRLEALGLSAQGLVRFLRPAPYLEMLLLTSGARAVLTDSGGLQKEAFILGTPCLTLRDTTEWVETVAAGANRLVGASPAKIRAAIRDLDRGRRMPSARRAYGDGRAAPKIAALIERWLRK